MFCSIHDFQGSVSLHSKALVTFDRRLPRVLRLLLFRWIFGELTPLRNVVFSTICCLKRQKEQELSRGPNVLHGGCLSKKSWNLLILKLCWSCSFLTWLVFSVFWDLGVFILYLEDLRIMIDDDLLGRKHDRELVNTSKKLEWIVKGEHG